MQLRTLLSALGPALRHRSGLRAAVLIALLAGAQGAPASPPEGLTVDVTVTGLRSARGKVVACLTPYAEGFPKCGGAKAQESSAPADAKEIHLAFTGVAPGRYAIALLHDENGNGRMDKSLLMMPREGYGFSRDAPVRMGPPKFDAAAFDVNAGTVRQTIRMRYMF